VEAVAVMIANVTAVCQKNRYGEIVVPRTATSRDR
jgi:hypothetical protein